MIMAKELSAGTKKGGEKGFALVLVLAILMTLTVFGVGVLTSTGTNVALTRNFEASTQAMNMAEIGAKIAYREFITSGFLKTTHTMNKAAKATGDSLLTTALANYTVETSGDFKWEWDSSKSYDPLWDTDKPHGFKFRVFYVTGFAFVIESEGWYGTIHRRIRAKGEIETMFQFSYFAARDLGEFARGSAQEIKGKVHANGNMFIKPSSGTTLSVNTSALTATGLIIRSRDAWGRPDGATGGTVQITKNAQDSGIWVVMQPGSPRGSEGIAFDSLNPNWNDKTVGAKALWGGVVRDKVPYKSPPPVQNLDAGGYYDLNSGLHITSTTHATKAWALQKTFFNVNEDRNVTVEDINVRAMMTAGDWPANGLIYSNYPVRITNADSLTSKLMFTSNSTIYTKGDVNTKIKKGVSFMTKQRIYHLSGNWDDAKATTTGKLNLKVAKDTTINAALVDGCPTVDEYRWADVNNDHIWDFGLYAMYDDWDHKTAAGFNNPYLSTSNDPDYRNPNKSPSDNLVDAGAPWANMDDLLEDWGSMSPKKKLTKFGSVVHLCGGVMCPNLDNSGITADQIAWIRRNGYWPPDRIYSFDPDLASPTGQPPFTPLIGHIKSWEPY